MPAHHERRTEWEERIDAALTVDDTDALGELLEDIPAPDLADIYLELDEEAQIVILDALSDEHAAQLLDELAPEEQAKVLDQLSLERTSDILDEMPSDEAADLLAELPAHEADALLQHMEPEYADDVADLLRYAEDTAGGLMVKEFVHIAPEQTVADVMALLRSHHDDAEMIYYLYVLDDEERLLGTTTLRHLIVSAPETEIADIMKREFISVPPDLPQDEVAEVVRRHDLLAVPVIDADGHMLGMVTVDDISDVVQEEAAEELLEMSGSEEHEEAPRPWAAWGGWRSGLLALASSLVAAAMIWLFSAYLANWRDTAILLPLLLILAVTAGSQAVIAIDRGYETAVERRRIGRIYRRELLTGAMLALIGSAVAAIIDFMVMRRTGQFALAVLIPLTLGLWTASLTGVIGASIIRRRGGWLNTISHSIIVGIALLLALAVYLLMTQWTMRAWSHPPL